MRLVGDGELWGRDARFRSMANRTKHIDAVYAYVESRLATRSTATWLQLLADADIPVAACPELGELIDSLENAERGVVHRYQDAAGRWYRGLSPTVQWTRTPLAAGAMAPRLGEHTDEVLREWMSAAAPL